MPFSSMRPSKLTARMAAVVLSLELFLLLFATLVVYGLQPIPQHIALIGGTALAVLIVITIGLSRTAVGITLGWVIQLLLIATGILIPTMFLLGAVFGGLYGFAVIRATQLTANEPREAPAAGETPAAGPDVPPER